MHGRVSTYQHFFLANCRFAVRFAPWPNLPNPLVHYEDGLHIFGIPQKQHVSHVPHPPPTHKSLSSLGRRPNFSRFLPPPTPSSFPLSRLASSRDAKLSVARDRKTNVDFFRARGSPDGRHAGDWVEEARECAGFTKLTFFGDGLRRSLAHHKEEDGQRECLPSPSAAPGLHGDHFAIPLCIASICCLEFTCPPLQNESSSSVSRFPFQSTELIFPLLLSFFFILHLQAH